jgi:flagellar biosynthetic protein FliR
MEFINYLGQGNVVAFFLLLVRTSALMVFFPFFSHAQIPETVKMAVSLMLAIFLFPLVPPLDVSNLNVEYLVLEILAELLFGLCAGALLMLVFAMLQLAGEQISMIMGFSMATVMDPQSGINSPLISNVLSLIVLTAFLMFDGHHLILAFLAHSVTLLPLGGFYPSENLLRYVMKGVANMFMFGFILSFPIVALSLLADFIFGMLMKTMPQFNLLVVGFPIKITVAFVVLMAVISAIIKLFTTLITRVLNDLPSLFF